MPVLPALWLFACASPSEAPPPSAEPAAASTPGGAPDAGTPAPGTPTAGTGGAAAPAAPPKPDAALTPEQRKAYLAALDRGRKAHRAKDWAAAVAGFDAALALQPDDPRALAERGWARLQAGQLVEAEADTRAALARTTDAKLLGSTWYNLGRLHEAQGRAEDAAAAYRTSLTHRPNATVNKRLAGLPGGVRDPYTAVAMAGPYATLDAWCEARKAAGRAEDPDAPAVVCVTDPARLGEYEGPTSASGGPFQEVRLLAAGRPLLGGDTLDGATEMAYTVAVRTAAGWYTRDGVVSAYNPGAFGIFEAVNGAKLAVEHERLLFAYSHDRHDSDMGLNEAQSDDDDYLLVCAVGPAGPSCVDPVVTATRSARSLLMEDAPEPPGTEHTLFDRGWSGGATVTPDGSIVVTGPPYDDIPGHVGTHRLVFP